MRNVLLLCLLSCGLTGSVLAQKLSVSLPIEGAVYQQNTQNQGKIVVRGDLNTRNMLIGGMLSRPLSGN